VWALLHEAAQRLEVVRLADHLELGQLAVLEGGDEALHLVEHTAGRAHPELDVGAQPLAELGVGAVDGGAVEASDHVVVRELGLLVDDGHELVGLDHDALEAVLRQVGGLLDLEAVELGVLLGALDAGLDLGALVAGEVVEATVLLDGGELLAGDAAEAAADQDGRADRPRLRAAGDGGEVGGLVPELDSHGEGGDFATFGRPLGVVRARLVPFDVPDAEDSGFFGLGGHG